MHLSVDGSCRLVKRLINDEKVVMPKFIVTANKLNRRNKVPASLPDPNSVVDFVPKDFIFDAAEVPDNEMPPTVHDKWFKDAHGNFYWGGGINELRLPSSAFVQPAAGAGVKFQFDPGKMSWAHDSVANGGLGIVDLWNEMGVRGEGVNVAILDTGIIDHDDFKRNGTSIVRSQTLISAVNSITDKGGHGTQCAGILCGTGNKIAWGIAPEIDLHVVKISSFGAISANGQQILEGLTNLQNSQQKIDIISISYSFNQRNSTLDNLIKELSNSCLVVTALNHAPGDVTVLNDAQFPASLTETISVAAYAKERVPIIIPGEVLSNKLNWMFPGKDIHTIGNDGLKAMGQNTSIATPIASGVFALYFSFMKKMGIPVNSKNISLLIQLLTTDATRKLQVSTNGQQTQVTLCNCDPLKSLKSFTAFFKP
jgi:serine protease AprX